MFWAGVKKKLTEEDTLDSLQKFALSISADSFIVYNKEESSLIGFYYSQETKEWRLKPWHNLIPPSLKEYRGDVLMAEETLDNLWLFLDAVTASAITLS